MTAMQEAFKQASILPTAPCPYCNGRAHLVGGDAIYPHRSDLYEKQFYHCVPCGAYVGCHAGTTNALGRLANAELRAAKIAAHAAFDPFWKGTNKKRADAYKWLSEQLGIKRRDCHIGMFNVDMCRQVVKVCGERNEL